MISIWESHCKGASLREIQQQFNIHNATVFRAIRRLKEYMKITEPIAPDKIILRAYEDSSDASLLFSTWIKSIWYETHGLREAESSKNLIDQKFKRQKTRDIRRFIAHPDAEIRIACLEFDPDQIIGWSAIINATIEFVYVKIKYRNEGVATLLTKGFTHIVKPMTIIGRAIMTSHNLKVKETEDARKRNETEAWQA